MCMESFDEVMRKFVTFDGCDIDSFFLVEIAVDDIFATGTAKQLPVMARAISVSQENEHALKTRR